MKLPNHDRIKQEKIGKYGYKYVIDFIMETEVGRSKIRTAWIITFEENYPRLSSIYTIK